MADSRQAYTGFVGDASLASPPTGVSYRGFVGDAAGTPALGTVEPASFAGFVGDERSPADRYAKWGKTPHGKAAGAKSYDRGGWLPGTWVDFEYRHAWLQNRALPPLVTTSPPGGEGVLPGSRVLFGGEVGGDRQDAGRLTVGTWLGPREYVGLVGEFFGIEGESVVFSQGSNAAGNPLLARPFLDTDPLTPGLASLRVAGAYNGGDLLLQGRVDAISKTDLLTADSYLRLLLLRDSCSRLDLVAGYQFARLDDELGIRNNTLVVQDIGFPGVAPGTRVAFADLFETQNKFHGGQLGLLGEYTSGTVTLTLIAKASLGNMNEMVAINGSSSIVDPVGGSASFQGGHLALPSNIGVYSRDVFTWIPEAEVKLTWAVTRHLDVSVGYSFLYFANVAMAGEQIETSSGVPVVNRSQWLGGSLVGPADPSFDGIRDSSLWLQGLGVGFTARF